MNEVIVFPDIVMALCTWLRTELAARGPAIPVGTDVPKPRPDKFVTLRRVGGVTRNLVTDSATVSFEAWAPAEEDAHDLAQLVRALVLASPRSTSLTVYRVDEFAGPASLPDPDSDQPRFTFTAAVSYRGAAV